MTDKQPEALRLADRLEEPPHELSVINERIRRKSASELRRLYAINLRLLSINNELLALVKRYRTETPIGNQPHMIAHVADEAIIKAGEQP